MTFWNSPKLYFYSGKWRNFNCSCKVTAEKRASGSPDEWWDGLQRPLPTRLGIGCKIREERRLTVMQLTHHNWLNLTVCNSLFFPLIVAVERKKNSWNERLRKVLPCMVDYFTCKQHQCCKDCECHSYILSHYLLYYTNVNIIFGNKMKQPLFSLTCIVATLSPSFLICGSHKFQSPIPGTKLKISPQGQSHPHRHCKTREIK